MLSIKKSLKIHQGNQKPQIEDKFTKQKKTNNDLHNSAQKNKC